jgi:two-component system sensor histidine kinase MprB
MSTTFNRMISRVERLVNAQRTFLSDTSHELRRPLTILRTDLDVLRDPGFPDSERGAVVREMQDVAESMSTLILELHRLARQDEELVRLEPTDLSALCAVRANVAGQLHPGHSFQCTIEPGIWVDGDSERLSRAIDNLLQNAALYTPEATQIEVELTKNGNEAVLLISDNGPGMNEEDLLHAFDRFYRGAESRRARPDGLGLGLAIVKQAMDRHDGCVSIQSKSGTGTCVTLRLPLIKD